MNGNIQTCLFILAHKWAVPDPIFHWEQGQRGNQKVAKVGESARKTKWAQNGRLGGLHTASAYFPLSPQAKSTKQICCKFYVLLYPPSCPMLFVFLCKPLVTMDSWFFYLLNQKAISLLDSVVPWFHHCVFIKFVLSFLSPCHLCMGRVLLILDSN